MTVKLLIDFLDQAVIHFRELAWHAHISWASRSFWAGALIIVSPGWGPGHIRACRVNENEPVNHRTSWVPGSLQVEKLTLTNVFTRLSWGRFPVSCLLSTVRSKSSPGFSWVVQRLFGLCSAARTAHRFRSGAVLSELPPRDHGVCGLRCVCLVVARIF